MTDFESIMKEALEIIGNQPGRANYQNFATDPALDSEKDQSPEKDLRQVDLATPQTVSEKEAVLPEEQGELA